MAMLLSSCCSVHCPRAVRQYGVELGMCCLAVAVRYMDIHLPCQEVTCSQYVYQPSASAGVATKYTTWSANTAQDCLQHSWR